MTMMKMNAIDDCMSWPVAGKGGKVNKWVKGGFGKRPTGAQFIKFDDLKTKI